MRQQKPQEQSNQNGGTGRHKTNRSTSTPSCSRTIYTLAFKTDERGEPQENNNTNMNPVKPGRFEMKPKRQTFTIQGLGATN
jgi:hypothetical protein